MIDLEKSIGQFVFVHGWGLDRQFWNPLIEALRLSSPLFLDRMDFADDDPYQPKPLDALSADSVAITGLGESWIGIGHSFGLMRLRRWDLRNMTAMVSLGGFQTFCGHGGTSPGLVRRMKREFEIHPQKVLEDFRLNCQLSPATIPGPAAHASLGIDLNYLLQDKMPSECALPHLALHAANDRIVPIAMARLQFPHLHTSVDGGHGLGANHAQWCGQNIIDFIAQLPLQ